MMLHALRNAHHAAGPDREPLVVQEMFAASMLHIQEFLAIGMIMQRIALARAFLRKEEILILDCFFRPRFFALGASEPARCWP